MRYRPLSRRPDRFWLNPWSPLAAGLLGAYLGPNRLGPASITAYEDAGPLGLHGSLSGYTGAGNMPADRCYWDPTLRRFALGFNGSGDRAVLPTTVWLRRPI